MTPEEIVSVARAHASRLAATPGLPDLLDALKYCKTREAAIVEFKSENGASRVEIWIDSKTGDYIEARHFPSDGPRSDFYIAECRG